MASQRTNIPIRLEHSLRVILLLAGLVIIGFGVHSARDVLVPLLLASCLVLAVQPLVEGLERRRTNAVLAVTVGMLAVLAGIALFLATLGYGASELLSELPRYEKATKELQVHVAGWLATRGLVRVALSVQSTQVGSLVATHSAAWIAEIPNWASHAALILVLTLFMLIERNSVKSRLLSSLKPGSGDISRIVADVQKYLGTKTLMSIVTGVLFTGLCAVFGLPNAPLWGALAFICNYVPVAGTLISALPPLVLALLARDFTALIGLTLGFLCIKAVIGNFWEPRVLGNSCGVSPLAVVVSIVVWGSLLGPTGALLSVPLTSVFRIAVSHVRDLRWLDLLITAPADGSSGEVVAVVAPEPLRHSSPSVPPEVA